MDTFKNTTIHAYFHICMYAFVIFGAWSFLGPDSRFHSKGSKATPRGGRMCSAKPVEAEPEIRSPDSRRKSPETRRSSSINNSCKVERATRVPRAHSALSLQLIHRPCLAFPLSPRLCSMPLFLFSLPPLSHLPFSFPFLSISLFSSSFFAGNQAQCQPLDLI